MTHTSDSPARLADSSPDPAGNIRLREHVSQSVRHYLHDLEGSQAHDVYAIVLAEVEIGLFKEILDHCAGNQSRAADMLGIHRATLRKKLREHGLA